MDNKILFAGGAVATLLLIMVASKRPVSTGAQVVQSVTAQNIAQTQNAPAIIAAASSYNKGVADFQLQQQQISLAASDAYNKNLIDVAKTVESNISTTTGQSLDFSTKTIGQHYANASDTRHVAADLQANLEALANQRLAIQGAIDIQNKNADNSFISNMIGSVGSLLGGSYSGGGGGSVSVPGVSLLSSSPIQAPAPGNHGSVNASGVGNTQNNVVQTLLKIIFGTGG